MKRTTPSTRVIPAHAAAWAQFDDARRDHSAVHALPLLPR